MARGGKGGRRGGARGRGTPAIVSGMLAGSNGDLVSQSGGRASTFQATVGSKQNKYAASTNPKPSNGKGGWIPGLQYAIYGPGGDSSDMRSARRSTPGVSLNQGGNKGPTNVSVVYPKVLGPKGFGGNYKLSKGY